MLNRRDLLTRGGLALGAAGISGVASRSVEAARTVAPIVQSFPLAVGPYVFNAIGCGPTSGELVLCLHGFPEFKEAWYRFCGPWGRLGTMRSLSTRGGTPWELAQLPSPTTPSRISSLMSSDLHLPYFK